MLRKIHTSSSNRKKFLHEQNNINDTKYNNVTRPPTSHPYSALRNIRSQDTLHNKHSYINSSFHEKQCQNKVIKTRDLFEQVKVRQANLPKIYLHMLTQIKILFRSREKEEEKLADSLLANLSKKISELYSENEENKKMTKDSEIIIQKLQEQKEQILKKLKKIEISTPQLIRSASKNNSKTSQYELILENIKLAQLNNAYLSKIQDFQSNQKVKHIEIKKEIHQTENTQILRYHNRISYLEMKLKNSQDKEIELNGTVSALNKKVNQLEEDINKLEKNIEQITQKLNQWRERAQMQFEDSQMHISRQNFLLYSIKKLRQLNKGLTQKLINQGNSEGQALKHQIQPNPYFQYEIDFFKNIKSIYFDSKFKEFKLCLTSKKHENLQLSNFQLEEDYLEYRKFEQINLTLYTYYMPTFYSLIEESITSEIASTRVKGNGSVSRVFIQIVRAILNSKLNEFIMFGEQNYTRFPQFVYTWFERFYFNSEKNDIAALQPYMQKPFPQDLFYRDLMNIKLDQSWEIITFREFLLEQLNLEQLYFYLMCQNLLFRKGNITKIKQYQGDFCIFVEYNATKSVLDMVLSDFESWNLSYLTSKMREKVIYKKNVEYIQSGFFLRCLVEYYKIQRINRFKYIVKLCDEFKSEQRGLRFSSFISVINRFTEVSIQQKIRLYRQCFCLGKGKITADIIFTVCSQKLIFLKYLKLKCFYKLPLLTTQKSMRNMQFALNRINSQVAQQPQKRTIICLQPSDPYLYQIYTEMLSLLKPDSIFYHQLQKMGLIQMTNSLTQMQKIFNDRLSSTDSSILRCRHFMHFISQFLSKIRVINFSNFYELLQEENKKKNNQSFWIDINEGDLCSVLAEQFNVVAKIYERLTKNIQWKNKVYDFRLQHAARKIQRMVRKKFIAPFLELYKIIYSQFKNGEQPKK